MCLVRLRQPILRFSFLHPTKKIGNRGLFYEEHPHTLGHPASSGQATDFRPFAHPVQSAEARNKSSIAYTEGKGIVRKRHLTIGRSVLRDRLKGCLY